MRIGILGTLDLRDTDGRPVEVAGRRLRALLIRLAIDASRVVSAERLIEDVWSGAPPAGAANALQSLISRARAAGGAGLVESHPGGYRLVADLDTAEFERLIVEAKGIGPERACALLSEALGLWRGPALADVADLEFAAPVIARLNGRRLEAIEARIDADFALGRAAQLIPELQELSAAYPLREGLRARLMRALSAAGRQAEALSAFEETREVLADELGIDPSKALAEAHLAVLRQEEPVRSRTNLPARITSFVGRDAELARLRTLLGQGRLVTLTGPGGAGKTRLAVEAAVEMLGELPDGVWFVPLASVRDALDVPQAVLSALGLAEVIRVIPEAREITAPLARLVDVLEARRLMLVLDNCEHLVDAVARVADRVLAAAPGVQILTTSREPLGITGERLCPVPSLLLPSDDAGPAEAMRYDAIRLFTDRSSAVRPGFAVDDDTVGPVVQICRALDGIPLAIELAAARLRALTPAQVAARLDDRFRLLTTGSRTAMPRHQTLRAVVDWSWELLEETERMVLRRLSVFSGGTTPEGAERICGLPDTIDVVASLIDKSLVVAEGEIEVRYRLLETVRAYAAERLAESGEDKEMRDAHAAYFLELAEKTEPLLRRHDQLRHADRLGAEHDNCTAALRWTIDTRDITTGLRLVGALAWLWIMRDYEVEAGQWAIEVWSLAGDVPPEGTEDAYAICAFMASMVKAMTSAEGLTAATLTEALAPAFAHVRQSDGHPALALIRPLMATFSGDFELALSEISEVLQHADPWARAAAHAFLGFLRINQSDLAGAESEQRTGYELFRSVGDRWGMALVLSALADIAMAHGDYVSAMRNCQEACDYVVQGVNPNQGAPMMIQLGRAQAMTGDIEGARVVLRRGVRGAERIGERSDVAYGLIWLSDIARRTGDLAEARSLLEEALVLVEPNIARIDFAQVSAICFGRTGCLAEQEGDLEVAADWHRRAMEVGTPSHHLLMLQALATVVEGLAALQAARGDHAGAAGLLGTAHSLHGFRDPASFDAERTQAAAIAAIGRQAFDLAYERGRQVSRADALELRP